MTKPLAWSFSALQAFETCPWRYYLTRVTKQVQEPQSKHMAAGNEYHKALELAIKGECALPEKFRAAEPLVQAVRSWPGKVHAERKFALTKEYRETTYFAKDVWLRGVFDVAHLQGRVFTTIDWKTGKRKLTDQNKLMAAAAFMLHPGVERVDAAFAWLPIRQLDRETYTRDQLPELWKEFNIRVERMTQAVEQDRFPKRPSGLCREWCPVGRANCEHWGK